MLSTLFYGDNLSVLRERILRAKGHGMQVNDEIGGLICFYGLAEWWMSTFTPQERILIEMRYQPVSVGGSASSLTKGTIRSTQDDPAIFLDALASWFRRPEHRSIQDRIRQKVAEIGESREVARPGYFKGRHFTSYVEDVKQLKREGRLVEAEALLLNLIAATESESESSRALPAPWYYDQLRIVYKKLKRPDDAAHIVARYERACIGKSPEAAWRRAQEELRKTFPR